MIEQKFGQIDKFTGSREESWGKVKETTLLDNPNNDLGKMKIPSKEPRIILANRGKKKSKNYIHKRIQKAQ